MPTTPSIAFIIVAAGRGRRFGGPIPKQYAPLLGQPVLRRTLEYLIALPQISTIQTVIHPDDEADFWASAPNSDLIAAPVHGGKERQDSVRAGLEALATSGNRPDIVMIHDAARPFLSPRVYHDLIAALADHDGAVAALPVVDSLRKADGTLVGASVERDNLWRVQTPQAFTFDKILAAHKAQAGKALTDDTAIAQEAGLDVAIVTGEETLFKITGADDLTRAETHMLNTLPDIRTGQGYDVHQFEAGDKVILCGIDIPHTQKLKGHSDADVGLHALTDAILGALGAGDIGDHFPPSDPQWKGAASDQFLRHAAELVASRGGVIANLDLTLICEAPKIGPHRDAMQQKIGQIINLDPSRVSVKATTTEKLGFTGRGEGIAAMATATIRLP